MSRDVITVGSTMRIPLLYRGEYSQWRERFMNCLKEQTDGEAMINSIQTGDHPFPVVAQVSLTGTAPNTILTLKDPKFWTAKEKKTQKIDRLARSLLIQGLSNDIYSLIDSNETVKDLWDALERQMHGSEYDEQDRKAVLLYEYKTFKATEGEQLLDTYLRYLQQYQGDVNDALGYKKKVVVVTSDPLALVAEKKNCKKAKVKDYNYYKTKMLLAKKDKDEQVLLAENQAWMESSSNYDQEINANMVCMAKMEKVLSYSDESSSSAKETIVEKRIKKANQQTKDLEIQNKDLKDKYDVLINQVNTFEEKNNEFNEQMKVLHENNADLLAQTEVLQDQLKVKHVVIDTHTEFPANTTDTTSGDKSGRTVTLTAEDMQRKKNDVKARTTLLLSLPNEHQLRFSKYKTARELWAAILKTFGEIEQDDLNQKFLTSLALEWLLHTIVWRNRSDLDTMSLDDLYNHLKVYESEVQKKTEPNSQNMAFISLAKHSSKNEDGNTACVPTASTNVPTATASVATISQDTACAYIASQSSGSQIKFKDINQIDEDDMEEMDIKWNMALLSMRADKFWKKTRKMISIHGSDVAGFDKSKVECFNCHKMGHFVRECRAPRSQDRKRRDNFRQGSKAEEQAPKALMTGLPECANDTVTDYSRPSPTIESISKDYQNRNPFVSKTVALPITPKPFIKFVKPKDSQSESPDFVMKKKACFNCGDFNHLASDCRKRVKKNLTPRPVAHRPYRPSQRPVRTNMNDAHPNRTFFNKQAHSYTNKPVHRTSTVRTPYRASWVPSVYRNYPPVNRKLSTGSRNFPTAKRKFPTASRKFLTGSTKSTTADMGIKGKAVKSSKCWFWKPSPNLSNKGSSQNKIDDKGYWESGCSRHMTGNISYLSDFKPFDGGYVSFGQGGCKIIGKRTIKTGKLEFENVYFVKDLKDFKLLDDANILLRTPRQHNMYSIDLNNIVPHRDLTCLVFKASADECMLWHRRLGHLNFKTMNELVRHNLVRGLPTKCFENDHTCIACLKGKQHKASWIKREFSNARTPQQNGVAERRNRTLIEAARTMLANTKLPVTLWAETVNTACYVQNRVLVNKSYNKTPYELFNGKFKEKGDEGYFIRYSMSSKAFRVFNKRTRRVEENLHVEFLENKAIEKGASPNWLFDIDSLSKSMNYMPVDAGIIPANLSGTKDAASQEAKKDVSSLRYIALPNWAHDALLEFSLSKPQDHCSTKVLEGSGNSNLTASTSNPLADPMETLTVATLIPTVSLPVPTAYSTDSQEPSSDARLISKRVANHEEIPSLDNILSLTNRFEDILRGTINSDESNGVEADISNMDTAITASLTSTLRNHKDHPKSQIIVHVDTPIQTKNKSKEISDTLQDPRWVEAMQEELLQFKIQNVWTLVDCPKGVRPIGTKWVLKNKKDKRGIVIRNKARLVAQGHTQEEGIDYDEVFVPVARIVAIRLFLTYASFMGFVVHQMDVKIAFLYGTIDEKVYVMQPHEFQDLEFPAKVYKVEKAMYGLHQAPRAWYGTLSKYMLKNGFQRGKIDQTLFIRRKREDFILVQVYVDDIIFRSSNPQLCREFKALMHEKFHMTAMGDILNKFRYSDVRHQVTPKECHLHAVKRIFRYLKGHPKLGLLYPKESPFELVAFSDSDYGGATQDRKSTTGGCQFLCRRLISWQCQKQTIVATSTTEAEYVAAASCYGQVMWIQNQLLDYGDCFKKKLISVDHIHTDENVADLLTKPFDAGRFQYLV
nr:hypothetical protein [Tanacetum cinerariifolium]